LSSKEILKKAHELYDERCKLAKLYYRLDIDSLRRVNRLLDILTDDELRDVAAYAEGLASWRQPDSNSVNVAVQDTLHPGG